MDEQTTVQARRLRAEMDRETALFVQLGEEVEKLKGSFQDHQWIPGLEVAERIQGYAGMIEQVEADREAAFRSLRDELGQDVATGFSVILPRLPEECRGELEESWRGLRTAVVRLKTASGRLRYAAEALGGTLTRMLEALFPQRRGRIYSRRGTATAPGGSLLVDRKL
jgi:hypothetical protein